MATERLEEQAEALIFDWNARGRPSRLGDRKVMVYDETLRDGLQGPSVYDPPLEAKKKIIELLDALGVAWVNLGLPGAGPRAVADVTALAKHIRDKGLAIKPSCAARTHVDDIRPVVDIMQEVGTEIEVMTFLGTSAIRQYVEHWTIDRLLEFSTTAIDFAVKEGLIVTFVTEDTIRSHPQTLSTLFRNAIDYGVQGLCLCDTVGHGTPDGVRSLVGFTRALIDGSGADVRIDWHGHNDRGLALPNTLAALEAGVDRAHGTVLGIGERVGNTATDQLLVNLILLQAMEGDLTKLTELCDTVAEAVHWDVPNNYPITGSDAFRTATGVHAAAMVKAEQSGDKWVYERVYTGVPAEMIGREHSIEIGPMSGVSNVRYWLRAHGYPLEDAAIDHLFDAAKRSDHVFSEDEVHALLAQQSA
jgi:2-isopropylmalate synthase